MKNINLSEINKSSILFLKTALEDEDINKFVKNCHNTTSKESRDLIDYLIIGAIYSYHNQLRENLLEHGIDIGAIQEDYD